MDWDCIYLQVYGDGSIFKMLRDIGLANNSTMGDTFYTEGKGSRGFPAREEDVSVLVSSGRTTVYIGKIFSK